MLCVRKPPRRKDERIDTLTFDYETTTSNKGNPFDVTNKAVCLSVKVNNSPSVCRFYEDMELPESDLYVAFNAKFDLHWSRRLGFKLPTRVWCCQLAEFYLSRFTAPYPSLENTAVKYGLGHKIDKIKLNYWDKGIDTDQIPQEELAEYANQDTDLTYSVYLLQREQFAKNPNLLMSFKIACEDLLVLEEMEWNGLIYDKALCLERSAQIENELREITAKLAGLYPDVPINFSSGHQLSAFLYGGNITQEVRTQVGVYKSGAKLGQPRYSLSEVVHTLPRLVTPIPKSELATPGVFATDEATLRKLKGPAAKKYVSLLLRFAELEKLNGTYYAGLVKLNTMMNWPSNEIHGEFNQVVAKTGRLSAKKPNQQNLAGSCLDVFTSRYHEHV